MVTVPTGLVLVMVCLRGGWFGFGGLVVFGGVGVGVGGGPAPVLSRVLHLNELLIYSLIYGDSNQPRHHTAPITDAMWPGEAQEAHQTLLFLSFWLMRAVVLGERCNLRWI